MKSIICRHYKEQKKGEDGKKKKNLMAQGSNFYSQSVHLEQTLVTDEVSCFSLGQHCTRKKLLSYCTSIKRIADKKIRQQG